MSDTGNKATRFCDCHEHGVTGIDQLVDLLNQGVDQRTASLALWAPERLPGTPLTVQMAGAEAAGFVRRRLYQLLPWLRPLEDGAA